MLVRQDLCVNDQPSHLPDFSWVTINRGWFSTHFGHLRYFMEGVNDKKCYIKTIVLQHFYLFYYYFTCLSVFNRLTIWYVDVLRLIITPAIWQKFFEEWEELWVINATIAVKELLWFYSMTSQNSSAILMQLVVMFLA